MRESDIKNKWSFLLKDMNFDNKYHDDIEYYLEYHYIDILDIDETVYRNNKISKILDRINEKEHQYKYIDDNLKYFEFHRNKKNMIVR